MLESRYMVQKRSKSWQLILVHSLQYHNRGICYNYGGSLLKLHSILWKDMHNSPLELAVEVLSILDSRSSTLCSLNPRDFSNSENYGELASPSCIRGQIFAITFAGAWSAMIVVLHLRPALLHPCVHEIVASVPFIPCRAPLVVHFVVILSWWVWRRC